MNIKQLYKTGLALFKRSKEKVRVSKAYRQLSQEQQDLQLNEAALEGIEVFSETGKQPRYQLSVLEGGEARRMTWRERRRQKKLGSLQIWTEDEMAEYLSTENRLLLVPKQGKRQAVSPPRLERLVAAVTDELYQGNADNAITEAANVLKLNEEEARERLKGFVLNYEEHSTHGVEPLGFFDKKLVGSPRTYHRIEKALTDTHGVSGAMKMLTSLYGMQQHAPLDRIVNDSVIAYNAQVAAFKQGDTKAIHERYERAASMMGLEQEVYTDALREHVASNEAHYKLATGDLEATVDGYASPGASLERFDRNLLRDYDSFAEEIASMYASNEGTVQEIAEHVTEKYGMRVSSSHVSSMAREHIEKRDGERVYTRKEAKQKQTKQVENHPT